MGDYLIGVQARIEDAALLAEAGRHEGALLMLLVSLSATSRRCYPESKVKSPGAAFKRYVDDMKHHLSGIEDALRQSGQSESLGDFLWKTLRNSLEHDGQLAAAHHPAGPEILVNLSGDSTAGVGLNRQMLVSLEKAVSRCAANSWAATREEMRRRHPEQPDEPTVEIREPKTPDDWSAPPRERLERIDFFLRWFTADRRATEALITEKAELQKAVDYIAGVSG